MRTDNVRLVKELRALANGRQDDDTTITPVVMEAALRIEELERKNTNVIIGFKYALDDIDWILVAMYRLSGLRPPKDFINDVHSLALIMNEAM